MWQKYVDEEHMLWMPPVFTPRNTSWIPNEMAVNPISRSEWNQRIAVSVLLPTCLCVLSSVWCLPLLPSFSLLIAQSCLLKGQMFHEFISKIKPQDNERISTQSSNCLSEAFWLNHFCQREVRWPSPYSDELHTPSITQETVVWLLLVLLSLRLRQHNYCIRFRQHNYLCKFR